MFSDAQQRYIASLVASMRAEYPYYIAYSDYRNSSSDSPQLYIVFCKEKITSKGLYSYVVPAGVRYAVNTYNYSSYNSSSARTVVTAYSGGTLNIPVYEWIYTNSEFSSYSVQPDVNSLYGGGLQCTNSSSKFCCHYCFACFFVRKYCYQFPPKILMII